MAAFALFMLPSKARRPVSRGRAKVGGMDGGIPMSRSGHVSSRGVLQDPCPLYYPQYAQQEGYLIMDGGPQGTKDEVSRSKRAVPFVLRLNTCGPLVIGQSAYGKPGV